MKVEGLMFNQKYLSKSKSMMQVSKTAMKLQTTEAKEMPNHQEFMHLCFRILIRF